MSTNLAHDPDTNAPRPPSPPATPAEVVAWLDYNQAALITRRDEEVGPTLKRLIEAHPQINDGDEETAALFAENVRIAQTLNKAAETAHKAEKQPFLDGGRAVDGWKNRYVDTVDKLLSPVISVLSAYKIRQAEIDRLAREAEAQRAEAAAQAACVAAAAAVNRSLFGTDTKLEAAILATQEAKRAADAAAARPAARVAATRGVYGAVASLRTTWDWKLVDISKLSLEFLQPNEDAIKAAMKQRDPVSGKPTREIPGIAWVQSNSLGVR